MVNRLTIHDLPLKGLKKIERRVMSDHRGFLSRVFCGDELVEAGWVKPIVQINHTYTKHKGSVRGFHFQHPPYDEMKLVSCLKGEVWDVAVDMRKGSATFLQWHAEKLSEDNLCSLLIPEGFAHGFQTIRDDCELLYFHSACNNPEYEGAVNIEDPALNVEWPIPVTGISQRDKSTPFIHSNFKGLDIL